MPPARLRVLVVDDDEEEFLLTRELLERAFPGAAPEVEWRRDEISGFAALTGGGFNVCLLDYRLGSADGIALLERAVATGLDLPVILFTGVASRDVDLRAMEAGAADFLQKGKFDAAQLERAIRYSIDRSESSRALRRSEERFA